MENKKGKIVAVLAEKLGILMLSKAHEIMQNREADLLELRLDCLDTEYLTRKRVNDIITELKRNYPLIVSIRNLESVPHGNTDYEGFRIGGHDGNRIDLLRDAASLEVDYIELEHHLRRNIFIGGEKPKLIIPYYNFARTPALEELEEIYAEIARVGANYVKFETLVRSNADCETLLKLQKRNKQGLPLTVVGRGFIGSNVNKQAYEIGGAFVYGIVPQGSFSLPWNKLTYQEMPTLNKLRKKA